MWVAVNSQYNEEEQVMFWQIKEEKVRKTENWGTILNRKNTKHNGAPSLNSFLFFFFYLFVGDLTQMVAILAHVDCIIMPEPNLTMAITVKWYKTKGHTFKHFCKTTAILCQQEIGRAMFLENKCW